MKITKDKIEHFIAGFVIYVSSFFFLGNNSAWLVMGFALGKEFYDRSNRGCVELEDILATILGGFLAFLIL